MIVGAFIIFNTFTILVAQRVRELALLRALGASRKQVRRSVLVEAVLMAFVGVDASACSSASAWPAAWPALFSSFGLEINSSVLNLTPTTILAAYAVGIVVTVAAAYLPARRASKVRAGRGDARGHVDDRGQPAPPHAASASCCW